MYKPIADKKYNGHDVLVNTEDGSLQFVISTKSRGEFIATTSPPKIVNGKMVYEYKAPVSRDGTMILNMAASITDSDFESGSE